MTNDYKERIIKYLTNNYSKDTESTTPFFAEDVNVKTLQDNIGSIFTTIQGYIQGKDGKGNDLDIGFIYGYYGNSNKIAIVDSEFNVLQVIDEFNTGTKFNRFQALNIDITNGNIYGIDKQGNNFRFILLNNFLVKTPSQQNYEVKLRNSYFLDFNTYSIRFVEKCPSASLYIIIGSDYNTLPEISTYKIEVGAQNELVTYTYQGYPIGAITAYNIEWQEENYKVLIADDYSDQYNNHGVEELSLETGDEYIQDYFVKVVPGCQEASKGHIVITNDATYLAYKFKMHGANNSVRISKLTKNGSSADITEIFYEEPEYDNKYSGLMYKKNNLVYSFLYIAINQPATPANTLYKAIMGLIDNDDNFLYNSTSNLEINDIISHIGYTEPEEIFDVKINYNLLTYNFVTTTNRLLQAKQVYNAANWNYTDYQDYNSMVPTSGILYDSDGNTIFARNLYNKIVNGNITTSSLEVPNMLLNDTTISQEDLLGATNDTLVTNEDDITKNIYEDLFINFINTLTMQDQNTQEYVYNLNGATRLNVSISNTTDYTNATLNKIRINYTDNTSYVKSISPATRISQFVYQYVFNVYVTKAISTIELISNDTLTTYETIDGTDFEIDKAYRITQNVEIQ